MMKKITTLLFTAALTLLSTIAFAQTEVVDFGTLSTIKLSEVVDQNVKMLEAGGNKVYQLRIKGQDFTRGELIDAHDQASRKMKNSPNYFRLWFYQDPNTNKQVYYVGTANLVINNAKDFDAFLKNYKNKEVTHFELKLNDYALNKEYKYTNNMGLKGDYWIRDTYIADGAVVRIIDTDPATLKASSKTYKVNNYKEMVLAAQDGLNNLYDVITIETPTRNDKVFAAFSAYYDAKSNTPLGEFSTHASLFTDSKKVSAKQIKGIYTLCFAYDRPKTEIKTTYNNALIKANEVVSRIIKPNMTPYEKVQAIHDYSVKSFTYNLPVLHFQLEDKPYHNITTILTNDGVCNGYAFSIKAMLDKVGIENRVIYGTTDIGDGNGDMGHAWNLVKLDGKFYHMDATWDDLDGADNNFTYENFLIDDQAMGQTHEWVRADYPPCTDKSLEYYTKNSYIVSNADEFYRYADQHLDGYSNILVFRSKNFTTDWLDNRFSGLFFSLHPDWRVYSYSYSESSGLIVLKLYPVES